MPWVPWEPIQKFSAGTQNIQGWQAKSSETLESPWDTGGLAVERPRAQPFPYFPHPQPPLSASTPAARWERQVAEAPTRQWATFTVALISGSPMSRFLRAIKIIRANANSGGQPEAQRRSRDPAWELKPNLTPVIFHLPFGLS